MLSSTCTVIFLLVVWKADGFNSCTNHQPRSSRTSSTTLAAINGFVTTWLPSRNSLFSRYHQVFKFSETPNNFNGINDDEVMAPENVAQARELLKRAEQLKAEARAMEIRLEESRSKVNKRKSADIETMMNKLFVNDKPLTADAVASILREERFSEEQLIVLLEALWKRQKLAAGAPPSVVYTSDNLRGVVAAVNQTEFELLGTYMQVLVDAAAIVDDLAPGSSSSNNNDSNWSHRWSGRVASQLKSRLNEWSRAANEEFKRNFAAEISAARKTNATVAEFMKKTLGIEANVSSSSSSSRADTEPVATAVPMWVPSSLLSYLLAARSKLEAVDVKNIKERVLPKTHFFCTSSDSIKNAAIFRGNMRPGASAPVGAASERTFSATVLNEVQGAMDREDGLSDRIQIFLLPDPEWRPTGSRNERESSSSSSTRPKAVILALPKDVVPDDSRIRQRLVTRIFKQSSAVLGLAAAFVYSVACYALNPKFFDSIINQQDLTVLKGCLPLFAGVLAIQAAHELAHRVAARKRGIKIGLPLLLPSFQVGTFGCITPLRSFPPNRAALLDFALSGPILASCMSVLFMIIGCYKTVYASEAALLKFPVIPVAWLKRSFLTGSILTFLLPKVMMLPLSQPIPIHPLFMAGFSGLLANALNLLPIFRLDGGRACAAAMGTRVSAIFSAWTLLTMFSLALSGSSLAWTFGAFVLFFQRKPEIPTKDEVTAVDDVRIGVWIASLVTAALVLLPFPGGPGYL